MNPLALPPWSSRFKLWHPMLRSFFLLLLGGLTLARAIVGGRTLDRIIQLVLFVAFLSLGLDELHSNPQVALPAAILGCIGVSILCGLAVAEFLYGHIGPSPSVKLQTVARINHVLILAMVLRMFFGVCAPLMEVRWPTGNFWPEHWLAMAIRWAIGLIVPMILLGLAQRRIRQNALRRWRRVLFPAMLMILIGEAIALHLTQLTGLPF
jgi:hypothetical protein